MPIHVGVAQSEITPPVGIAMTGYIARDGNADGVHDPLYAKALALTNGTQAAILITCDLLGLDGAYVARVRQAITQATGIAGEQVLITCSHTHAGPASMVLQDCGAVDESYMNQLEHKIVNVVCSALEQRRPARFGIGRGQVTNGVHNRRRPGDVIDPALGIWQIADQQDRTLAIVLNYSCHPTCLTGENQLISAEYPGYAVQKVQAATGAITFFITGAIGDIGPAARGWAVLEQLGESVANETLRVLPTIALQNWRKLTVRRQVIALPLQPLPTVAELNQEIQRWQGSAPTTGSATLPFHPKIPGAMVAWAQQTLAQLLSGRAKATVATEVQVIEVGPLALVSAPGELFVELGLAVKRGWRRRHAWICGFANDSIGYIPTRRAYPAGGYEIAEAYKYYGYPAALGPEAGEHYVATARALIGRPQP